MVFWEDRVVAFQECEPLAPRYEIPLPTKDDGIVTIEDNEGNWIAEVVYYPTEAVWEEVLAPINE